MISLRVRDSLRRDEGVAMLFVIAIGLIVAILAVSMFAAVLQNQKSTRTQRNITSAQGAAEAGLDDMVYKLGQIDTATGKSYWSEYTPTGTAPLTQSSPFPLDFGANNASASTWMAAGPSGSGTYYIYVKGSYGGNTRTIRATVTQSSPPAFDYSMFASKGIDIHQHGGWLSPQVWTTSVHSNGYIYIDYPSQFNFNVLEAVGNLTVEKGGGKIPSGTVPASGYSWLDPLNGLCYPGGPSHPGGIAPSGGQCTAYTYPGNAELNGSVYAGSLTLGSHGVIKNATPLTLDTGQVLDGGTINGSVLTGSSNVNCATSCNKSSPTGGQVQGSVTVQSGYAPPVIPFPSIDLATVYGGKASGETNNPSTPTGTNHFTSPSSFLTWATTTTSNFYNADSNGNLTAWSCSTPPCSQFPDVILLKGDFDISGGGLSLDYGTVLKNVQTATGMTGGGAPIILVQGALVVDSGSLTLSSGLVVIGGDENYNGIVHPYNSVSKTPAWIDTNNSTGLLKPATQPGIVAAGGQISSNDYDTDSPWSSSSTYEPLKAAPVYIRGLVYSALWNATTQTSTPQNQHWHNFDPKNLMKIYGSQVGADLHNCNNFSFTYDPIVKNAFGFGGGSVKVIDYQELGN